MLARLQSRDASDVGTLLTESGSESVWQATPVGPDTERLATPSNVHAQSSRDDVERLLAAADLIV